MSNRIRGPYYSPSRLSSPKSLRLDVCCDARRAQRPASIGTTRTVLNDYRDQLVNERVRLASRLRWHLVQIAPELEAGGRALTIATVLPEHRLAFELISTYVGHAGVSGHVTHLALGPIGYSASIEHVADREHQLDPASDPRACAYDHAS